MRITEEEGHHGRDSSIGGALLAGEKSVPILTFGMRFSYNTGSVNHLVDALFKILLAEVRVI